MAVSMGSRSEKSEGAARRLAPVQDVERVLVGEIVRPHGLRGEVKVDVHTDIPERFERGAELWLGVGDKPPRRARVQSSRPVKGGLLVRFDDIAYRDEAEALRGARLEVDAADVPQPPEGFYYYFQLIGCHCVDADLGDLGPVLDVVEDGGGVLLEISHRGQKLLLPFVNAFLSEVDIEGQRIDWKLPPGLVETCTSKS